jgi:hypothetical protein
MPDPTVTAAPDKWSQFKDNSGENPAVATTDKWSQFKDQPGGLPPVAKPGIRALSDQSLAPGSEDGIINKGLEYVKGAVSSVLAPLTHPIETIKGMGAGTVGTGMSSSGYPIFGPTGNKERDLQNVQTGDQAKVDTLKTAQTAVKEHPAYTTGQITGPLIAGEVINKAPAMAESVLSPVGKLREAAQNSLRAGPRMVEKLANAEAERFQTGRETTAKANELQAAKHSQKTADVEQFNQQQAQTKQQRSDLAKTVDQKSVDLGKSIENVEKNVGDEANRRFETVKAKVGQDAQLPPTELIAATRNAEGLLNGVPENIKEFRRIYGMEGTDNGGPLPIGPERSVSPDEPGYEGVRQAYKDSGLLKESEPLTWDKLQSLKSRLDARLRGPAARGMNGDLKRALYAGRDAVVDQMGKMAEAAGAGNDWAGARDFYRQYKEDFATPHGPSGSGSPVASALDAVDPSNIRQPFLRTQSTIGNRGIDILRKYPEYGGSEAAQIAQDLVGSHQQRLDTPRPRQAKPTPTAPVPQEAPPAQGVDITNARYNAIRDRLADWKGLSKWEARTGGLLAIPERAIAWIIDRPSVVNWIKQPTPADLAIIDKMPPEVKNATLGLVQGLAEIEAKKTGLPLQWSPEIQARIRDAAKYVGASAPSVGDLRKKAKSLVQK